MNLALSIVIPSYGRSHLVKDLLASIVADEGALGDQVEVLLIDDTPSPERERIAEAALFYGATLIRSPTKNVGGKRNYGATCARHDLVLFLDSDVTIKPGTLRAHFERLISAPDEVVGCLGKVVFVGERTLAWRVMEVMQLNLPFAYPDIFETVLWGPTANLCVRRSAFNSIGGFDDSLLDYGGEDVDLGLRWDDIGKTITVAPDAIAYHAIETWSTWRANMRRLWSFGAADYYLITKHPARSFLDFPTAPMLWLAQITITLILAASTSVSGTALFSALTASVVAYPAFYTLFKRKPADSPIIHILGPIRFWTMDLAKAVEALRHRNPEIIFRRMSFLDDMIAQDWREVSASAWGVSASALSFAGILLVAKGLAHN